MVPALEDALAVGRDERDDGDARAVDGPGDELRGLGGQPAEPALLPGAHEPPHALVVLDSRPRRGEREAAARALPAAAHGPHGRSAAPFAERRPKQRQALAAASAQLL